MGFHANLDCLRLRREGSGNPTRHLERGRKPVRMTGWQLTIWQGWQACSREGTFQ